MSHESHVTQWIDRTPREYSDFSVGEVVRSRGRTINASDVALFAGLVGNYYPLHTDAAYAAKTRFGQRVVHGSLVYSIAVGLMEMTGYYGDAIIALLGVTDMKARRPVFAGTTIHVLAEVTDAVPSETSGGGRVTVLYSVRDSGENTMLEFTQTMLMRGSDQ